MDIQNFQANQMTDQDVKDDFKVSVQLTGQDVKDDFEVSVQLLLSCQDKNEDSSKVISMVPSMLRNLSSKSFDPRVVSIGPLHHGKENLKINEELKKKYIRDLLSRLKLPKEEKLKECLRKIYESIPKIKECYVGMSCEGFELARMMVADACFILEFCYKYKGNTENALRAQSICVDLLLVENQIPLFVLDDIFNILKSPTDKISLTDHILPILDFYKLFHLKLQLNDNLPNYYNHILGLLYACYLPENVDDSISSGYNPLAIHSAGELDKAGVKF